MDDTLSVSQCSLPARCAKLLASFAAVTVFLIFFTLVLGAGPAGADTAVDQEQNSYNGLYGVSADRNYWFGQTFTPAQDNLAAFQVRWSRTPFIGGGYSTTGPMRVRDTVTGEILASVPDVTLTSYACNPVTVTLSEPVELVPGRRYAIETLARTFFICGARGNPYPNGNVYPFFPGSWDSMFRTYFEVNTPASDPPGTPVEVTPIDSASGEPGAATLTFDNVSTAGQTTTSTSTSGPVPPTGFKLGNPSTYFALTTTATYSGDIEVCIDYSGISFNKESKLKLMHRYDGLWTDITSPGYPDTANDVICGVTSSLSEFAPMEPDNDPPIADADGPYTINEGEPVTLDASGSVDPDGDALSYRWDVNHDGTFGDAVDVNPTLTWAQLVALGINDGPYVGNVAVAADDGQATDVASTSLTISNVAPTVAVDAATITVNEGTEALNGGTFSDIGSDPVTVTASVGVVTQGTGTWSWSYTPGDDSESQIVTISGTDDEGDVGEVTFDLVVNNVAPAVTPTGRTTTVQYSDSLPGVSFVGCDVVGDGLTSGVTWSTDGTTFGDPPEWLPVFGASAGSGCEARYTSSEEMLLPAGTYMMRFTFTDKDDASTSADWVITVEPEEAVVWFPPEGPDENPVAVQVEEPGGDSGPFTLMAHVSELFPDEAAFGAWPGDISNAGVFVRLVPVGPGGAVDPSAICSVTSNGESGYAEQLTIICPFDEVPVNTYAVEVTVDVGGYYAGFGEDVLVVYDPSLGFTTGGGWFYWPDTEDRTNFGYTMKYNKKGTKVQGSLLMIRHTEDGIYRVKSNMLDGLALGEGEGFGWASFSGKATYKNPEMEDPVGNHYFTVYVEDRGETGSSQDPADQFWIETMDGDRIVIDELSMGTPAPENTESLEAGNIVVPHGNSGSGGGGGRPR